MFYDGGDGGRGGDGASVTVTSSSDITTQGTGADGLYLESRGGNGGKGGDSGALTTSQGGTGGRGGNGGQVNLTNHGAIQTAGKQASGIYAASNGGAGGDGGWCYAGDGRGGSGYKGGNGGQVVVTNNGDITTGGNEAQGITAKSSGGQGGDGGTGGGVNGNAGNGSHGGVGGSVNVTNNGVINTAGEEAYGIQAQSSGGDGGHGGTGGGGGGEGGSGGIGGNSGNVNIYCNQGSINTTGKSAHGIYARSQAGSGGHGGTGGGIYGAGGDGGNGYGGYGQGGAALGSGPGGEVEIDWYGTIKTQGKGSRGIFASSVGGFAGGGGSGGGLVAFGASGNSGGDGGQVTVTLHDGKVATKGDDADAIFVQSVGGGGGSGGLVTLGGSGNAGGHGGKVKVHNKAHLKTAGDSASGIYAQSVGGGGGNGGGDVAIAVEVGISIGGSGGSGGNGEQVSVANSGSISTSGASAYGIFAQSLGGGGGDGGYSVTAGFGNAEIAIGGSGGSGGSGGQVSVASSNTISTSGDNATGILAQSLGGGGGVGDFSVAAGSALAMVGVGGSGGSGGNGGEVDIGSSTAYCSSDITTTGFNAQGIFAQSVGGGGGGGGVVNVYTSGAITTSNEFAYGILAQSVGGGGGNGGFSFAGDLTLLLAASFSLGGSGNTGGDGAAVTVNNTGSIATGSIITNSDGTQTVLGTIAHGIYAQSVGGGGGNAGWSGTGTLSFSVPDVPVSAGMAVSLGGAGGSGGDGGDVIVSNGGAITTYGFSAYGIFAQSMGGGGGSGGGSVAAACDFAGTESFNLTGSVSLGGQGGSGGTGGQVTVTNDNAITTLSEGSLGILAQSLGGGGNGHWSVGGEAIFKNTLGLSPSVTVGGSGGSGGNGGTVTVTNGQAGNTAGAITTSGDLAPGILAQSIGGGGGNGGATAFFDLGNIALGNNASFNITPTVSVGGSGGGGGSGGQVTVNNYADISTTGTKSYGLEAQSVGGGGGNGGSSHTFAVSAAATKAQLGNFRLPATNISASAAVGGHGGNGNDGGTVSVTNAGGITTQGIQAYGIFAQSVSGGGGVGGNSYDFNIIAALSNAANKNSNNSGLNLTESVSVGGHGGGASNGGAVTVSNSGAITTSGSSAYGIFAQSVGGGGGVGGSSATGLTIPSGAYNDWKSWVVPSGSLSFTVGGDGGSCGNGGQVTVTNSGAITTSGDGAFGIYAQSLGGGGGVASYDQSQMFSDTNNQGGTSNTGIMPYQMQIGGKGGAGGDGGEVQVTNRGAINTSGDQATGIYAQSIGGGGGSASVLGGPYSKDHWESKHVKQWFTFAVDIGRSGGSGGNGGAVTVTNTADITTQGNNANGIFAQSVGGAGGSGSEATAYPWAYLWNGSTWNGASGDGGAVTVTQTGNITTSGEDAHGIVAQSIAGQDKAGNVAITLNDPNSTATPGNIITSGLGSCGIVAQSLGAGGCGNVDITINQPSTNSGLVQGGLSGTVTNPDGSTTTYNAYGVLILDGNQNTLTNYGAISTLDGQSGTAVMVQASYGAPAWGNLTIDNYGTITGSVDQGTQSDSPMTSGLSLPTGQSTITFNNNQGSTYNAGPVINLGGGTLNNSGTFNPYGSGSANNVGTVNFTSNFNQTANGNHVVEFASDTSYDHLAVTGPANLNGTLTPSLLNGFLPQNNQIFSGILTAGTGVFGTYGNVQNFSPTLRANVIYNANSVDLKAVRDYNNPGLGLAPHLRGVGAMLNSMADNASGDLNEVLRAIDRLPTAGQVAGALGQISHEKASAMSILAFAGANLQARNLSQRITDLRFGRWRPGGQGGGAAPLVSTTPAWKG